MSNDVPAAVPVWIGASRHQSTAVALPPFIYLTWVVDGSGVGLWLPRVLIPLVLIAVVTVTVLGTRRLARA